jgi:hypothetical protein
VLQPVSAVIWRIVGGVAIVGPLCPNVETLVTVARHTDRVMVVIQLFGYAPGGTGRGPIDGSTPGAVLAFSNLWPRPSLRGSSARGRGSDYIKRARRNRIVKSRVLCQHALPEANKCLTPFVRG